LETFDTTCRSCGAKMVISLDRSKITCGYCGSEQLFNVPTIATIGLIPDRAASEMAIKRLGGEIADLEQKRKTVGSGRGCCVLAIVLMLASALLGMCAMNESYSSIDWIMSIMLVALLFMVLIGFSIYSNDLNKKEWAPLDTLLVGKHEELAKHKDKVNI
jgi:amino acid transporter